MDDLKINLQGEVENFVTKPNLWLKSESKKKYIEKNLFPETSKVVWTVLEEINKASKGHKIAVIAHRVVHGGKLYKQPTLINAEVLDNLRELIPLAPLHQPYNLDVIEASMEAYNNIPQVAYFDTSFHRSQSYLAELFPLPLKYANEGIIRYGFHGLSYQYISSKLPHYAEEKAHKRVIVAHLGNGASLCAMKNLKSVSTSMGFTALDGLMMGTRPGNIDPGIILYLVNERGYSIEGVQDLLYEKSGLKGVSGISNDMRALLKSNDPNAEIAIELFCYIAAKHISSLLPSIQGLDVLVFTAGIGENCPQIRSHICSYFSWLGLRVDDKLNRKNTSKISAHNSKIEVYVIPTNEEAIMAEEAAKLISH
jgi:acetate kinase